MLKKRLDYISESALLEIYENYLYKLCDEPSSKENIVVLPVPLDDLNNPYRKLSGESFDGQVYATGGRISETGIGNSSIRYVWMNPQITAIGISYVENMYEIMKDISPREKLDVVRCIKNGDKVSNYVEISTEILKNDSVSLEVLASIVEEAEAWLQQRGLIRVYASETKKAKLIFTYDYGTNYRKIMGKSSNVKEKKSNGTYLSAWTVSQNCPDIDAPIIIINLSKILDELKIRRGNALSKYAIVCLTSVVIHEISHFYDDVTLPNSLWKQMEAEEKDRLVKFLTLFTEFKSKYYQELYYFENIDEKMRMKYVENELEKAKCDFSRCISTYDLMQRMAQIICWSDIKNIFKRKEYALLCTRINEIKIEILQRRHSRIFLKMLHDERTKERIMWRLSKLITN